MAVELPRVEEGGDDQLRLLASFLCIALELVAVVVDIALALRSVFTCAIRSRTENVHGFVRYENARFCA